MAVEQLYMMNVVGKLEDVTPITLDILESSSVNLVDAIYQLESNRDIYTLDSSKIDQILDLNQIVPFSPNQEVLKEAEYAREIMEYLDIEQRSFPQKDIHKDLKTPLKPIYEALEKWIQEEKDVRGKLEETKQFKENFSRFDNVDINLEELENLKYFETRFGLLDREGRLRMKRNYGNLLAYVAHTGTYGEDEVYMILYPKEVREEIDRILKSLSWMDVEIQKETGTPKEVITRLEEQERKLETRLKEINEEENSYLKIHQSEVLSAVHGAILREKVTESFSHMGHGEKYFCLFGWITKKDGDALKETLSKYDDIIVLFQEHGEESPENPPTKLRNSRFFKPFETLIQMYGTPNYNEMDPTVFVGITYLILFGSMFGDVGQGAIFAIAGLFLSKKNKDFGGLLLRMGVSSIIFGFLYGSVFGNEEIIKALWIRPFENINQVLMISIGFGVILLSCAYIMGIINALKMKDREEALFGKEGIAGFVIFLIFVTLAIGIVMGKSIIPTPIAIGVIVAGLLVSVFKKPLIAKLEKRKVEYPKGDKAGYYIESSFSLLEMLISILSGTVSFIRVGAFAINHVGLFMAFQTMSQMMSNHLGSIIILLLGNVLIIFLEGLIVFIQGLRLEYYELFSRYYHGDGYEFKAAGLSSIYDTKEK